MKQEIILKLNNLNKTFYKITAEDFDDSRQYYWKGWEKLLPIIRRDRSCACPRTTKRIVPTKKMKILDIGCGNARFAKFLAENLNQEFQYTGIDNSEELLQKAQETCNLKFVTCNFQKVDVIQSLLNNNLSTQIKEEYDLIVLFGVMHHIPSFELRRKLIQILSSKLSCDGIFVFTSWQFAKEERFENRIINPSLIEIDPKDLEENDYILDWRRGEKAYRYCHFLNEEEIKKLVEQTQQLEIKEQFYADGKSEKLNLYTILKNK